MRIGYSQLRLSILSAAFSWTDVSPDKPNMPELPVPSSPQSLKLAERSNPYYVACNNAEGCGEALLKEENEVEKILSILKKDLEPGAAMRLTERLLENLKKDPQSFKDITNFIRDKENGKSNRGVVLDVLIRKPELLRKLKGTLIEVLSTEGVPKEVAEPAALGLAAIGNKEAKAALINALTNRNQSIHQDAAVAVYRALILMEPTEVIDDLITILQAPEPNSQGLSWTISVLRSFGEKANKAIPALAQIINSKQDEFIRNCAVRALGEIGSKQAAEVLMKALSDKEEWVRVYSASGLGKIGSKEFIPGLVESLEKTLLEDSKELVKEAAAKALIKIGSKQATEILIKALKDKKDVAPMIIYGLGEIGSKEIRPGLIEILEQVILKNNEIRAQAVEALCKAGTQDIKASEVLFEILTMKGEEMHYAVGGTLVSLKLEEIIPLTTILKDKKEEARGAISKILKEKKGLKDLIPLPILIEKLKDPEKIVRAAAAQAIGEIGPPAKSAEAALIENLTDPIRFVRETAAEALGKIKCSEKAIPHLEKCLKDTYNAIEPLVNLNPDVQLLVGVLCEADPSNQIRIVKQLGKMGNSAKGAVPALGLMLETDKRNEKLIEAIAKALSEIGSKEAIKPLLENLNGFAEADALIKIGGENIIPDLTNIVKDEKSGPNHRACAVYALGKLGKLPVDIFIKALKEDDPSDSLILMKGRIARAFGAAKVKGVTGDLAKELEKALQNKKKKDHDNELCNSWSILMLIDAIGDIGESEKAIPALTQVLKDKDQGYYRKASLEGLNKIRNNSIAAIARAIPKAGIGNDSVKQWESAIEQITETFLSVYNDPSGDPNGIHLSDDAKELLLENDGVKYVIQHLIKDLNSANTDLVLAIGRPCLNPLLKAIEDKTIENKAHAAFILGEIGKGSEEEKRVLECLNEFLNDKNPRVRDTAKNAIWKINREETPKNNSARSSVENAFRESKKGSNFDSFKVLIM